ncbi:YncE family protein [Romboutsia sedimentorum]|uniref:YncE family protein n=1 Tax=Romboutsia sedimentorum TaxID=1368474 RepID=UPI0024DE2242|nr:YncE family protein [Romboutsia sedimentorum]MDK2585986.1 YncE family protein [Romboutsia sedimentorum]
MKVYISNYLSKSISVLSYPKFEVEKQIDLDDNINPHHFCIDKEKNLMYIPSSSDGILYVLDITTNNIIESVSIGGNLNQIGLCKGELFISNEDSNSIYILDQDTLNPIAVIGVDEMPHGFDFNESENKLYVSCINSIVCIDTLSKCIDRKIDTDFKAWHVKIDKKKREIYTSTLDGKLVILDEMKMKVISIIEDFLLPVEVCFSYSAKKIYVADLGYKHIKILDYDTGSYLDCINVEGNPQGLAISKDEKLLLVSDTQKNSIKIYNTNNNELIKEVKTGKEPTTILCV